MGWDLHQYKEGALLHVKVQPNAPKNNLAVMPEGVVRIKVTAGPVKGAANQACIKLMSRFFKVPKSRIMFIRGLRSKEKWLWFRSVDPAFLTKALDSGDF